MHRAPPPPAGAPVFPVFVGHIPLPATVADLRALFSRVGRVLEVTIVAEHGFVNFSQQDEAVEAVERYNGHLMCGQPLHVDYSEELAESLRRRGQRVVFTKDPWLEEQRARPRLPSPVASRLPSRPRSPPPPSSHRRSPPRSEYRRPPSTETSRAHSPIVRTPYLPKFPKQSQSPPNRQFPSPSRRQRSPNALRHSPGSRSRSPLSQTINPHEERRRDHPPVQSANGRERKDRVGLVEELSEDKKMDLRDLLRNRKNQHLVKEEPKSVDLSAPDAATSLDKHIRGSKPTIKIKIHAKDEQREIQVHSKVSNNFQELYVGNLFNEVEKSDLERLFEQHGKVVMVMMRDTYAIVSLDCTREAAEKAIGALDRNLWMDNNIRVQFNLVKDRRRPRQDSNDLERQRADDGKMEETREPRSRQRVDSDSIDDFLRCQRLEETSKEPRKKQDRKMRTRHLVVHSQTMPRSFLADMTEVFVRFGEVHSCSVNPDGQTVSVKLSSTERQALDCIVETNKIRYKGGRLKVKFMDGTEEDAPSFRQRHPVEFHDYPHVLVGTAAAGSSGVAPAPGGFGQLPIGVLPPSSSLGAFGATPSTNTLNSIIENARAKLVHPPKPKMEIGPAAPPLREDPQYASSVEGEIHSIDNKIVIVHFYTGFSFQFAKLIPGQMYVNGKRSLGYIIKNNTFHTWPTEIKNFLHQGAKVKMDVRKMSELEIADTQEITSEYVRYSTPLVWRNQKPEEADITISSDSLRKKVLKGVVKRIYPKWGVLTCSSGEGIFFEVRHYFNKTATLGKEGSLLQHLTVGDAVAVQCHRMDYLEMAEIARQAPGFSGGTDNLQYYARLVWPINSEVDPFAHKDPEDDEDAEECKFLTTSSTLNSQLPAERDSSHRSWPGSIEEIHLPAGGIVLLDESLGLDLAQRRVYFHRSRIFLNGAKIMSNTSLDSELAVGDPVTVDVILNLDPADPHSPPYVFSGAFWVALAMQVATRDRGSRIARALRAEGESAINREGDDHVARGRIIHFQRPEAASGPVLAGTAVIDTGPFAGQKVEFERRQCQAFGFSLGKADLSQVFKGGEPVFIQVKPYNSFCVENLFVGFKSSAYRETGLSPEERLTMKGYLISHGLDFPVFEQLVKGKFPSRPFIPLAAQPYRGRIRSLKSTLPDRSANVVMVDVDLGAGDVLKLEARREEVFVYGHWMGKADLRYILDDEDVFVEYVPQLDIASEENQAAARASIVWLGDADDRPVYQGQANCAHITSKMDASLWTFVRTKKMDERMFRALVEGRLPPKEPEISLTTADGSTISLDQETLAQAALLKQMKSSFGSSACLQAMMMFMAENKNAAGESSSTSSEMQRLMQEALGKNGAQQSDRDSSSTS